MTLLLLYNEVSDLNNMTLFSYSCGGPKSKISLTGLKAKCLPVRFLLEAPGENLSLYLLRLLLAAYIPWLVALPFTFEEHHSNLCF